MHEQSSKHLFGIPTLISFSLNSDDVLYKTNPHDKDEQSLKQSLPNVLTDCGIFINLNFVHPSKTPMLIISRTESEGIEISLRFLDGEKAYGEISFIVEGILKTSIEDAGGNAYNLLKDESINAPFFVMK